uniref:Ig-like domain-containing protein n=1 Tax=Laticauda laticaudata TaxID=8630 RepID=A0A8C5WWZ0_LATLA
HSWICHYVDFLSPSIMVKYNFTQETALSASLGESATLSCKVSSGFHFLYFTWYQQKEGESPRFILYYNTTSRETKFGPEASGHFSASTNTPKEIAFLTINNVQAKDEGNYHCDKNHGR